MRQTSGDYYLIVGILWMRICGRKQVIKKTLHFPFLPQFFGELWVFRKPYSVCHVIKIIYKNLLN